MAGLYIFIWCVCVYTHSHICARVCVNECWRLVPDIYLHCPPLYFLRQGLFTEPRDHCFHYTGWGTGLPVPTTPSAGFRDMPPYLLCVGSGDLNAGSSASGWAFTHWGISPAPLTCIEQQHYWGMPSESATLQNSCSVRNLRTNSSNLNQDSCFWNNNLCVSKLERTRYLWDTMSVILKINKCYTINSIL